MLHTLIRIKLRFPYKVRSKLHPPRLDCRRGLSSLLILIFYSSHFLFDPLSVDFALSEKSKINVWKIVYPLMSETETQWFTRNSWVCKYTEAQAVMISEKKLRHLQRIIRNSLWWLRFILISSSFTRRHRPIQPMNPRERPALSTSCSSCYFSKIWSPIAPTKGAPSRLDDCEIDLIGRTLC